MERRLWSEEEDAFLKELVQEFGERRWTDIASQMKDKLPCFDRNGKQCRERWFNHLSTDLRTRQWEQSQLELFIELHRKNHNRWSEIAKCLPGRFLFYQVLERDQKLLLLHHPPGPALHQQIQLPARRAALPHGPLQEGHHGGRRPLGTPAAGPGDQRLPDAGVQRG